jgi:hypothetical protein
MATYLCEMLPWITRRRAYRELVLSGYRPDLVLEYLEHEEEEEVVFDADEW